MIEFPRQTTFEHLNTNATLHLTTTAAKYFTLFNFKSSSVVLSTTEKNCNSHNCLRQKMYSSCSFSKSKNTHQLATVQ